ncbi:Probable serine/threonine-protein kinase pix13 [Ancistrocladus abbreviatus]
MGNCLGFPSDEANPSTVNPSFSSGISGQNSIHRGFSGSGRSSSANSQFLVGGSESCGKTDPNGEILETPNLRIFTFAELRSAAKNFKPEAVLGQGGFGKVYKGWIDDKARSGSKILVAIKKLNPESVQGFQEWQSEVNFLGRLSHPNLVKLLGYCWEDQELLLVYEYMAKGSLENHLFRRNPSIEPLTWERRISIVLGAARGLAFLHTLDEQIIYRDFKAANILLDGWYNAKLSDFGLAKLGPSGKNSHVTTRIMGTRGYAAPEYVATGHLYVKSDVYGFGVMLLEMLTGLRALDVDRPRGQEYLAQWAKPYLSSKKKLKTIMDVRMEGQYAFKAALEAAQLTLRCVHLEHKARPSMKEVVEVLQRIEAIKKNPNERRKRSPNSAAPYYAKQPSPRHSPYHPQHGNGTGTGNYRQSSQHRETAKNQN